MLRCTVHRCRLQITAQDYLETALMPVPGAGPSVEAKNQIRSSIKVRG